MVPTLQEGYRSTRISAEENDKKVSGHEGDSLRKEIEDVKVTFLREV